MKTIKYELLDELQELADAYNDKEKIFGVFEASSYRYIECYHRRIQICEIIKLIKEKYVEEKEIAKKSRKN